MLNASTIDKMKNGAIVINTTRGKLINEDDLYDALTFGKLMFARLDVHYEEPILILDADPLCTLDNIIYSSHIAGLSFETFHPMMKGAVDNIEAYEEGRLDDI